MECARLAGGPVNPQRQPYSTLTFMAIQNPPSRPWLSLPAWAALLLALCLLLYMRPYYGIRHDSILYLGQALLRWKPEQFGHDLFFAYGSQAQFTIFPQLLAGLLPHFPAADLLLTLTFAGRLSFLFTSFVLIRQLLPKRYRYWGLLSVLIMPSGYGAYNVFAYAEPFATGRSFSEPLILFALAAFISRHWYVSAAAWLLAAALHPLQALPAALLMWVYLLARDRRWSHLLWPLIVAFLLLAEADSISPFFRYDAQWLEWIRQPNKHVFIFQWRPEDWCYLITDLFLISLTLCHMEKPLRELTRALLVSTLLAFSASILLADVLHLVLPTGLQLWRMQWLLHWVAMATLPLHFVRLWEVPPRDYSRITILIAIAVLGSPLGPLSPPFAVLILIPLFLLLPQVRDRIRPALAWALTVAVAVTLLILYAKFSLAVIDRFIQHASARDILRPEFVLLSHPLAIGSLLFLAILQWNRGCRLTHMGMLMLLTAWMAYAGLDWDRRSTATRHIESAQTLATSFGVQIVSGAQVLWTDELLAPWLILNRPSYFSGAQTAGLLFNRGTAEEAHARSNILKVFELQDTVCDLLNTLNSSPGSCQLDPGMIHNTCNAAAGKLSYIVTPHSLRSRSLGKWSIPVEREGDRPITYYLYQCSDFLPTSDISAPHPTEMPLE